jgi:acetyl-CoA synthetase (ADP-forming)
MHITPKKIFKKVLKEGRKNLMEHEARLVLEYYKIKFAKWALARNSKEALKFSEKIGYPVVLKIVSPDIPGRKSDIGGVFVNLLNPQSVEQAFNQIIKNVKKRRPKAKIEGILISKMVPSGKEIIVGGVKDPQFGQTIMFGAGGVLVELLEDVSFRIVPIKRKDAEEMIEETKVFHILKGYRGKPLDVNAVIDILLKTSKLLEENQNIKEMDMNPIMVFENGAMAVDARIILE